MHSKKILRNNIIYGIKDSFKIIYGHHNIFYKFSGRKSLEQFRYGAADIYILPLIISLMVEFGLSTKLMTGTTSRYCVDEDKANPLKVLIGYFGVALQLPRYLFAMTLTLCSVPIIIAVHMIKYPFVKVLEFSFFQLR